MDAVLVRVGVHADLDAMLALYRHLHPGHPDPEPVRAERAWSALLAAGLATVFLAESGGVPVATCTLVMVPNLTWGTRPYGLIENVVTDPSHRRRGFGQAVLKAALDAAWQAACYKVMLATGSRSEATLRFYEAAGFERGGKVFFQARRVPARA